MELAREASSLTLAAQFRSLSSTLSTMANTAVSEGRDWSCVVEALHRVNQHEQVALVERVEHGQIVRSSLQVRREALKSAVELGRVLNVLNVLAGGSGP